MTAHPAASRGWPWGGDAPTGRRRLIAATAVALAAAALVLRGYIGNPAHHSDFSAVWIGARILLEGGNPYSLVGPGLAIDWPWPLRYPATAYVAAAPLALMPEWLASTLFSGASAFLLVYGMTRDSWFRIPALVSGPFLLGVAAAQWSPLFTASWFIPALAVIFVVKPTSGFAAFFYSPTTAHRKYAIAGAALLTAISFAMMTSWPGEWLAQVRGSSDYASPLLQRGGFLIPLVLLRWRRREAWIVFLLALVPQAHSIYDVLPLLVLVPRTYRQAAVLAAASNIGFLTMIIPENDGAPYHATLGFLRNLTCYLPAAAMVLTRPNRRSE